MKSKTAFHRSYPSYALAVRFSHYIKSYGSGYRPAEFSGVSCEVSSITKKVAQWQKALTIALFELKHFSSFTVASCGMKPTKFTSPLKSTLNYLHHQFTIFKSSPGFFQIITVQIHSRYQYWIITHTLCLVTYSFPQQTPQGSIESRTWTRLLGTRLGCVAEASTKGTIGTRTT